MTSARAWKQFETVVARLLGGRRFWSNSGEALDVESASYVAQCKLVKSCSLESLTCLVEQVERQAAVKQKAGVVAIKVRRGHGRPSPVLMVVTAATWERMHGVAPATAFVTAIPDAMISPITPSTGASSPDATAASA